MTENDKDPKITQLAEKLTNYVREYCKKNEFAMLLTTLGAQFFEEYGQSFKEHANSVDIDPIDQKLVPFIKKYCDQLEILPFEDAMNQAAVRLIGQPSLTHPKIGTKRYTPAFWAAFIKKIDENEKRILSLEPYVKFTDVPSDTEILPGQFEINAAYISGAADNEIIDQSVVKKNIDKWLEEKELTDERFLTKIMEKRRERSKDTGSLQNGVGSERQTAQQFFRLMPDEMKRRIKLPGDIVEYLLRLR